METVTSRDGTRIAYERLGAGSPVIIVGAALSDRTDTRRLAGLLADRAAVVNYDRRGRGDSGDTLPYTVEREIEDLAALIDAVGGSASLFGSSSGAVLALRAAAAGLPIRRLAVFEPPFRVDASSPPLPADYEERLAALIAAGRHGDAVRLFMTHAVGVPGPFLLLMRLWPGLWSKLTAMAPTLLYDQAVVGDTLAGRPLSAAEWSGVSVPTLVLDGGKSPPVFRSASSSLASILPDATYRTLPGQNHGAVEASPKAIAEVLAEWFSVAAEPAERGTDPVPVGAPAAGGPRI
jgi:hypothetical protein